MVHGTNNKRANAVCSSKMQTQSRRVSHGTDTPFAALAVTKLVTYQIRSIIWRFITVGISKRLFGPTLSTEANASKGTAQHDGNRCPHGAHLLVFALNDCRTTVVLCRNAKDNQGQR